MIEFGPILEALRWDGLFDLEIFSDAELRGSLWQEEPRAVAEQGVQKLRQLLSAVSA